MQVHVEKTGTTQAKISFNVPAEEFEAQVKTILQQQGSKVTMKGFRPGKVPPAVLEKEFGEKAKVETRQHFLQEAFNRAVSESKLRPAALPRVRLDQLKVEQNGALSHSFEVHLRPEIKLGQYKGLSTQKQPIEASEADVDAALADLRRQQSRPDPTDERGLPADGLALARLELLHAGQSVLTRDGLRVSPKIPPPGVEAAAFEQGMSGVKEGDTREFKVVFPPEFEKEELRGKDGIFRLTVTQTYKIVPLPDAEIYKLVQVENEAQLREKAKEHILLAKTQQEHQRQEAELFTKLLAAHEIPIASELLEEQTQTRLESLRQQAVKQGRKAEEAAHLVVEQAEAARTGTERAMRAMYLVEAIGEQENLKVSEQELGQELTRIAQRNNAKFEEVRDYYQKNNLFGQLALELLERKVRAFLRENAL